MLLVNNGKTMIKFYIFLAMLALSIVGSGYYYLNSMQTTEGSLNINKIEKIDNIYARSVYSDYYFRVMNYSNKSIKNKNNDSEKTFGSKFIDSSDSIANKNNTSIELEGYYSELIPLKMSMGYNFSDKKNPIFLLKSFNMPMNDELSSSIGTINEKNYGEYIDKIKDFKDIYSKIITTQDQDYFDESYQDTQNILNKFFKNDNNITLPKKHIDDYYTHVKIPLKSLSLHYMKLEKFQLKNSLLSEKWQPNIATWVFGDSKIILQYLKKSKYNILNGYYDHREYNKDELRIKTLKIKNNEIIPTQYIIDMDEQTMTSLEMVEGGHIFILKMKSGSKQSLLNGMHDFMRINSGLFSTKSEVDKWFTGQQDEAEKYLKKIKSISKEIKDLNISADTNKKYGREFTGKWDEKFDKFKKHFETYPNKSLYEELTEQLKVEKENLEKKRLEQLEEEKKNSYINKFKGLFE